MASCDTFDQKMNRFLTTTYRFAQTIGVISTVFAMLFVSSAQGAWEECFEETATQEIELVLGRRPEASVAAKIPVFSFQNLVTENRVQGSLIQNRYFVVNTERDKMNGFGTNLLI